jgi:hypothetical protein
LFKRHLHRNAVETGKDREYSRMKGFHFTKWIERGVISIIINSVIKVQLPQGYTVSSQSNNIKSLVWTCEITRHENDISHS